MTVAQALSASLDALFRTRKLKPSDLTEATGISSATVSKLRSGQRWPSLATMEQIREFFGVAPYYLLKPDAVYADTTGECAHEPAGVPETRPHVTTVPSLGGDMPLSSFPDPDLLSVLCGYWRVMPASAREILLNDAHTLFQQARTAPGDVGKVAG